MRANTLLQAYNRARLLRQIMLVVFCFMFGVTLLWALPWVPWGLGHEDYTTSAGIPVALAIGAWLSAFGAVYLRDQSNRYEQALVTWSSVRDDLGDLRRREYFYERTVIECARSEDSNIPFTVFAIKLGIAGNHDAETMAALEVLGGLVRQTDTLAALGPQEVGVLAVGMGTREAPAFALRLRAALRAGDHAREDTHIAVGWGIWGSDAREAGTLVGIARQRMQQSAPDAHPVLPATATLDVGDDQAEAA